MSNRPNYPSDNRDKRFDNRNRRPSYGGKPNRGGQGFKKHDTREIHLPTGTVVYILDILPHGHIDSTMPRNFAPKPLIQAIETPGFNLFEIEYGRNVNVSVQEKIIITNKEDCKLGRIVKRLTYNSLTQTSKDLLLNTIELHIQDQEKLYLDFLNNAGPITKKRHMLNLLPGVGEKLMWDIINTRNMRKFDSLQDFDNRVSKCDIKNLIAKRILNEIIDDDSKHYIFVKRKAQQLQQQQNPAPQKKFERRENTFRP